MRKLAMHVPHRTTIGYAQHDEDEYHTTDFRYVSTKVDRHGNHVPLNRELAKYTDFSSFATLSTTKRTDSDLFNHQEIFRRLMMGQDRMILSHKPGTGKTITQMVTMCQMLKIGMIEHIYIVNKNEVLNNIAIGVAKRFFANSDDRPEMIRHIHGITYNELDGKFTEFLPNSGLILDEAHNIIHEKPNPPKKGLLKVLAAIKNCHIIKLIVTTATPIINKFDGLIALLSLIEGRMIDDEFDTFDELQEYILAHHESTFSYVEPNYENVTIEQQGDIETIPMSETEDFHIGFTKSPMRGPQLAEFITIKNDQFQQNLKRLSISTVYDREYFATKPSKDDQKELDRMAQYSGKVAECLRTGIDSKYCVAIYSGLKKEGSEKIALYLERLGYRSYDPSEKDATLPMAKRYLLYTPDTPQLKNSLKLFNSGKNVHGSYIKFIIGSQYMRDSVDIHNCDQIHIIAPEWHITGFMQVWYRIIRNGGQRYIIFDKIKKLMKDEHISYEEAKTKISDVVIKIYNHVLFYDDQYLDDALPYLDIERCDSDDDSSGSGDSGSNDSGSNDSSGSEDDGNQVERLVCLETPIPKGKTKSRRIKQLTEIILETKETEMKIYKTALRKHQYTGPVINTIRDVAIDHYILVDISHRTKHPIDIVSETCFIGKNITRCTPEIYRILNHTPYIYLSTLKKLMSHVSEKIIDYTVYYIVEYAKSAYFPVYGRKLEILLYNVDDPILYLSDSRPEGYNEFTMNSGFISLPHYAQVEYNFVYGILPKPIEREIDIPESIYDPMRKINVDISVLLREVILKIRNNPAEMENKNYMKLLEYFDEFWSVEIGDIVKYKDEKTIDLSEVTFYVFPKYASDRKVHYRTIRETEQIMILTPSTKSWEAVIMQNETFARRCYLDMNYLAEHPKSFPCEKTFTINDKVYKKRNNGFFIFKTNSQDHDRYTKKKIIIRKFLPRSATRPKRGNDFTANEYADIKNVKKFIKDELANPKKIYKISYYYGDFGTSDPFDGYENRLMNIKLRVYMYVEAADVKFAMLEALRGQLTDDEIQQIYDTILR